MFSLLNPARSIRELLDYLLAEDHEKYLYRGQTKDYSTLLPSRFRRGVTDRKLDYDWISVDSTKSNLSLTDRDRVKSMVRRKLMRTHGKGLGNIIAQQYGMGSEVVDVTECPKIAAFFATRAYPAYDHFGGNENNGYGVVYRIRRWPQIRNVAHLEDTVHVMELKDFKGKEVVWFKNRVALPALTISGDAETVAMLEKYFKKYGSMEADMNTAHARVTFSNVIDIAEPLGTAHGGSLPDLSNSRLARQRGGLLYPLIWHRCLHPTRVKLSRNGNKDEYFATPDLVAIKDIVAVHDLKGAPDFEAFYFRHGSNIITEYAPDYLWPNLAIDRAYQYVAEVSAEVGARYLSDYGVSVHDAVHGLVDPGYRT
ncbi:MULTISPECIES: FRG domain-containing protein [unclassified Bradyrhizobium]|uniref:FRG domain-containing protein n=1 Tax=unclassified Bradyrhizobium TaxID=2631580 RepID=UPI0029169A98|nr:MULTISPECIES: FRG domain-containing protein [unclassified Bradyrhizobium]